MKLKQQDIKFLIIHHTHTPRKTTPFINIKNYHMSKGWSDIGYHFFITNDGRIWKGRPVTITGRHAKDSRMNYKSLGICVAGNFDIEEPSKLQLKSLIKIIRTLQQDYKIKDKNIIGHREVKGSFTTCPGDSLLEWLLSQRELILSQSKINIK